MIERLPDLDRLQAEYNTIRDINEEMEKFNSTKKQKISLALKGITGSLLFAFFSMIFIFIKSIPLNTITGLLLGVLSLILVLLSAATGYYLYILVKKNYPEELLNRKAGAESGLLEIFTNENFPEKNFGTGELYEYLFQYFEDFLSFRDLQNELSVIKKGSGSRISIEEREEKLQSLSDNKENIRQEIEDKLKSLDINIHPVPERENIKNLVSEIDEMIEEILLEEKHKETIAKKIESESKQYKSGEKSQETIDASISEIDTAIEKLKKDITDINFMNKVYR
jgi:biotin operon repressor